MKTTSVFELVAIIYTTKTISVFGLIVYTIHYGNNICLWVNGGIYTMKTTSVFGLIVYSIHYENNICLWVSGV